MTDEEDKNEEEEESDDKDFNYLRPFVKNPDEMPDYDPDTGKNKSAFRKAEKDLKDLIVHGTRSFLT